MTGSDRAKHEHEVIPKGSAVIEAVLEKPRHFALQREEVPKISGDQLLIRVHYCGICGSDIHTYLGHNPFIQLPAVLGHELVGKIAAVGPAVRDMRVGDRVTYEPTNHCGNCRYCLDGMYNLCLNRTPTVGAFREFTVLRESQVHRVPARVGDKAGALIEPLASALHALDVGQLERGQRVLVIGSGAIGILITASAKLRGAGYVAVTNRSRPKLSIAANYGAEEGIHTPGPRPAETVLERLGENAIDIVFDTVANSETIGCALSVLKKGGILVIVGTPLEAFAADFPRILINELRVAGSLKYRGNFQEAISILSESGFDFPSLITRIFPLQDIQQAFEEINANSARYVKCLIEARSG